MTSFYEHMVAAVSEMGSLTADEKLDLVEISKDVIGLQTRSLGGEDVSQELAVVTATLQNIAAARTVTGAMIVQDALVSFLNQGLLKLIL